MTRVLRRKRPISEELPREPSAGANPRLISTGGSSAIARVLTLRRLAAEREAGAIIESAREEAQRIQSEARAAGERAAARAREEAAAEAAGLVLRARRDAAALLDAARDELTRVAVHIAEKLLAEELRLHPDAVLQIVCRCLAAAASSRRAIVRVNPQDVTIVEGALPAIRSQSVAELLVIEADPAVARGGCIVVSDGCEVDGRIQTRLRAVLEALG